MNGNRDKRCSSEYTGLQILKSGEGLVARRDGMHSNALAGFPCKPIIWQTVFRFFVGPSPSSCIIL